MTETLARAFPSSLRPSLTGVLGELPETAYPPVGSITSSNSRDWPPLTLHGDRVVIPQRIYNSVPVSDLAPQSSVAGLAIDCLYTRHHDGFVRQEALRRVLTGPPHPWTVPFVLQLLGEYVIEICDDIELFAKTRFAAHLGWRTHVRAFADENPEFMMLTKERATSYWQCYHRGAHLNRSTYPGLRALALLAGGPIEQPPQG